MCSLIAWFREEPFSRPTPWHLDEGPGLSEAEGRVIEDKWPLLFGLWEQVLGGPGGPGAKSGALREELSRLREWFSGRPSRWLYPCGRCGRRVPAVPDPGWPDHLRVDCPHGGYVLRGDVDLKQKGLERPLSSPQRWAALAGSGRHPDQVQDLFEGLFLFALSLASDPTRAREGCRTLPAIWAYYSPFWRERLPQEAFEELERRCQRRLEEGAALEEIRGHGPTPHWGLQASPQPPQQTRPFWQRKDGSCFACGSRKAWRSIQGVVICAICHPPVSLGLVAEWGEALEEKGRVPQKLSTQLFAPQQEARPFRPAQARPLSAPHTLLR